MNAEAQPGTDTGDDEGVKFFAIYGVPVLWHTNENVRIHERAFGVKRMDVLQVNGRACERALCANFFLRGTVRTLAVHYALYCIIYVPVQYTH